VEKQTSNKSNEAMIANSKGQSLTLHSLAVGILSKSIINDLVGDEKLAAACYVAGCLHDLGKIDPSF
jgi:CRISPR-associated endonuclease/helicase Cas3